MQNKFFSNIPVLILAGGFGTRLSEETVLMPKPMIEIGEKPMIWHIVKYYYTYGFRNFFILLGYKGNIIKEFFMNYQKYQGSLNVSNNTVFNFSNNSEDWTINLIETGLHSQTGGRIKRALRFIKNKTFCLTYGDGLSNVDLLGLYNFHKKSNKLATVTAVAPPSRFGHILLDKNNSVKKFNEKPTVNMRSKEWINGGFFILSNKVKEYIKDDQTKWEEEPLSEIVKINQLSAFKHTGFWQPVDTLREMKLLNEMWNKGIAPWKIW